MNNAPFEILIPCHHRRCCQSTNGEYDFFDGARLKNMSVQYINKTNSIWRAQIQVAPLMRHFKRSRRVTAGPPRRFSNEQTNARAVTQALQLTGARTWTFPQTNSRRFGREHNQSGPGTTTHQLRVSALFEALGTDQRHSVTLSCARARSTVSADRGHKRGVKGELHPSKKRKAFCHNLECSTVQRWMWNTRS